MSRICDYGFEIPEKASDLQVEIDLIRAGGFVASGRLRFGKGLFHHYRRMIELCWPEEDNHRWSDLMLQHYLERRFAIVQGPKDTGKTHGWSRIALIDYWAFPQETLWLVSSTDLRGLELRVWGDIKDLFNRARERWPKEVCGNVLESKHGIFTDEIGRDGEARDIRKGIICIPCIGGNGEWVGIEKYCGIKQKRRRLLADELQFMRGPYLTSVEHLDKGDFKLAGSGNPIAQGDPLDKLAEPKLGWGTEPQTEKTEVWENKWGGITINLDGRDTLNNDPPRDRFSYLLNSADIARTKERYGEDSSTYWTQVIGKRKPGLDARRVLTRDMCLRYDAFKDCTWDGSPRTQIYALDAGFGGDRAVGGMIEFGKTVEGWDVIKCGTPRTIPIRISRQETAEEQLTLAVRQDCSSLGISPDHVFLDAGMRATLVSTMAKHFSSDINPVNFGGPATPRPVSDDDFVFDEKDGKRRPKRCDEAYSKFVTELWFSVRLITVCRQMRSLPESVAEEFFLREWKKVHGDRYELETKEEMKLRTGSSPDYADWLSIAVEGARRLGFRIAKLASEGLVIMTNDWLHDLKRKHEERLRQRTLSVTR